MNVQEVLMTINLSPIKVKDFIDDSRKGVQKGIFLFLRNFFGSNYMQNPLSNELFDLFDISVLVKNVFSYDRELLHSISEDRLMLLFPFIPEKVFEEFCFRKKWYSESSNSIDNCLHIISSDKSSELPIRLINILRIYTYHLPFDSFLSMMKKYFWEDIRTPVWIKEYLITAENVENAWSGDWLRFQHLFNVDYVYPLRRASEEQIRNFLTNSINYLLKYGTHKPGHSDISLSFILKREMIPVDEQLLSILALWRISVKDAEIKEYVKKLINSSIR